MRKAMFLLRPWLIVPFVAASSMGFIVSNALAQNVASASIQGKVTDESGGVLPGVTVTVTGPSLQVPHTGVSDADGSYRVLDLPVGVYRATYELQGFQTFVREDLRLSLGFIARVDAVLGIGTVSESVTVKGGSPVVDLVNTTSSTTFQRELLETLPKGRSLSDVYALASGVSNAGSPDVGDSNLGARPGILAYGVEAQPTLEVEGISIQTDDSTSSAVYLGYYAMDEVQLKAAGNGPEVGVPGVNMVAVLKAGGNTFHGTYVGSFEAKNFQGGNITPELQAQGLSQTNPLSLYYDVAGDLGGRIIRDKLWFYAGLSRQNLTGGLVGFAASPGPDGVYQTADDVPSDNQNRLDNRNWKGTYQASPRVKLTGAGQFAFKFQPQYQGSRLRPLENTAYYRQPGKVAKGEIQAAPSAKLLIDALAGYGGYFADYQVQPGVDRPGNPSRLEQTNSLRTGPSDQLPQRPQNRWEARGSVTYFPTTSFLGGKHEFRIGSILMWEDGGSGFNSKESGNYLLTYNGGRPVQIATYSFPVEPVNQLHEAAVFGADTWTSGRTTLNLGVRWERYHAFYPEQVGQPGQFSAGGTFPARDDILTWNAVVPRLGFVRDLRGNGRSVFKATFGMYGNTPGVLFAQMYNPNSLITTNYRWTDPNGNRDYDPGEVNLSQSGPDFLSAFGGINQILNRDLQQPTTYEYTARFERELMSNVALSVAYVHKDIRHLHNKAGSFGATTVGVNVLRPASLYTIPIDRPDPGPDGVAGNLDDGPLVTIWDYPAQYAGGAFNGPMVVNDPENRKTYFDTLEATFTKRYSTKWNALASFWVTKNHQWIQATPQSPNDERFPTDETWNWQGRVSGSYSLPLGIQLAGVLNAKSGNPGQRTVTFRNIPQQSTVTLRMEPWGAQRGPVVSVVNLKGSKRFSLGGGRRLEVSAEVFNLFNASAATTTTYVSGSSFGFVTAVVSPRVARFGGSFNF